jgi:hypothetical protein
LNFLAWNGIEHIVFNYNLFKHLCNLNGISSVWHNRIQCHERIKEIRKEGIWMN